jgi:hypothetical protein
VRDVAASESVIGKHVSAGVDQNVGVGSARGIVPWEEQLDLNDALVIGGLDSSEPGVVEITRIVRIAVTVANSATVNTLKNY